jgi:hypothetical protein
MDGDSRIPHDFSQSASSGAAAFPIEDDADWGLTPPRLRVGSASGGRGPVAGGLGAPRVGLENLDLNVDCPADVASYPNMSMYTHLLQPGSSAGHGMPPQRARSDGAPQRGVVHHARVCPQ